MGYICNTDTSPNPDTLSLSLNLILTTDLDSSPAWATAATLSSQTRNPMNSDTDPWLQFLTPSSDP